MNQKEVINTLADIKNMMEKSSKFLSFSGFTAIIIGIYACIAAVIAYHILGGEGLFYSSLFGEYSAPMLRVNTPAKLRLIVIFAGLLIVLCIGTAFLMTYIKARKNDVQLKLDRTAKRLLWNLFMPLIAGGILCLSLIWQGHYGLTSSIMLIFYGIALINASNYTYSNICYLGYAELILGIADSFVQGHALFFWGLGFGIFHIVYGLFFYLKYDRVKKIQ